MGGRGKSTAVAHKPRAEFDLVAFIATLDKKRIDRGLSWNSLALEAGVPPSLLHRVVKYVAAIESGAVEGNVIPKALAVDSFIRLCYWARLTSIGSFIQKPEVTPRSGRFL